MSCPRCGSDRLKEINTPNRAAVTAPGGTCYQDGDKRETTCLNCGWWSVAAYDSHRKPEDGKWAWKTDRSKDKRKA